MTWLLDSDAEFDGDRIVEGHMQRMGGREQLLQQMYSAMSTKKDDTIDLALRSYGMGPLPRHRCFLYLLILLLKAPGCPTLKKAHCFYMVQLSQAWEVMCPG